MGAATTPVIDQAGAAYHGAQQLHDLKVNYQAADAFEKTQTLDKASVVQFPTEEAVQVRLTVLQAFKCYVDSVVALTSGVESPQLDAAAKSVGSSLTSVGNTLAPTLEDLLHLAAPTSAKSTTRTTAGKSTTTVATVAAPLITSTAQSGVSAATLALGEYLVSRKIRKELPGKVKTMDGVLQSLCQVLEDDIDLMQAQERRDLDAISDSEILFLQSPEGRKLDGERRRLLIAQLPGLVRRQRETDDQLLRLKDSLTRLQTAHHALALDAETGHPASLKAKLGDLAAAGGDLGKFYSSSAK